MEESVVLVSLCCFFAHICSRSSLLLSTDRVPRQTEVREKFSRTCHFLCFMLYFNHLNNSNNIGLRRCDMKIYNVKYFIWGIIFLIPLPLFAFGSIKADWWQWMLSIGISLKYLSVGLSKSENERQEKIEKNYQGVSQKLFGKYVIIKTNLPWVITGSFFSITLFVRFVFDVIIPVWIVVCFVIVLTISVFYSIGIERKIAEYIDKESNSNNQTKI